MFFDLILLRRQHKARFGLAWIAATRGINHLAKKDILELDIGKLCEEVGQYVCSESDSPRSRFSLRLSAVLTNGTVKIYRQKAVYIMEDLVKILTSITKPAGIASLPMFEQTDIIATPPSPIPKKRLKKRRPSVEKSTPQSQLERLVADIRAKEIEQLEFHEDQAVLQARAEEVTLRENQLQREAPVEEFGALAALPAEEKLIQEITQLEKETAPLQLIEEVPEPLIEGITPLLQEPSSQRITRRVSISSPEEQPHTITVEAQVHASADAEMETPEGRLTRRKSRPAIRFSEVITEVEAVLPAVVETITAEQVEKVPEVAELVEPRPVLKEMQVEVVEKRDKKVSVHKKKKDEDLEKLLISIKPTRLVRINRCEADEVDWIDIDLCPLPEFKLKIPNLTNLLNMYLVRDEQDLERRRKTESSSLQTSLPLRRKSGRETPPAEISEERITRSTLMEQIEEQIPVPEIQVTAEIPIPEEHMVPETPQITESRLEAGRPLTTSTPLRRKTSEIEERTIEEVMAVPAEERLQSPRKRRKLMDVEVELPVKDVDFITLPSEPRSRDLTVSVTAIQSETVDSVPLPISTEQGRQQDIVNKIFISGRLTLEEVCQKPINRLNIARAFSDVLVLCRYRYVTLVSQDDSSELKFIEKGPKMTH